MARQNHFCTLPNEIALICILHYSGNSVKSSSISGNSIWTSRKLRDCSRPISATRVDFSCSSCAIFSFNCGISSSVCFVFSLTTNDRNPSSLLPIRRSFLRPLHLTFIFLSGVSIVVDFNSVGSIAGCILPVFFSTETALSSIKNSKSGVLRQVTSKGSPICSVIQF